jgi:hypothetical protein
VRTKTCPFFEFSVEGAKGAALEAIDEKPRRLRQLLPVISFKCASRL